MSIEDRLAAAGMNYGLAAEVVAALKSGASTTAVRLSSFGLSGTTAIELARQINVRSADINGLSGIGFPGALTREIAEAILGAPPLSPPLQIVGSRGEINVVEGGAITSTNVQQLGRSRHYTGTKATKSLQIVMNGFFVDSATGGNGNTCAEVDATSSYSIRGAIEINGVTQVVLWYADGISGTANVEGFVPSGSLQQRSTPVLPSQFGLGVFPAGMEFFVRLWRSLPISGKAMFHQIVSNSPEIVGESYFVAGSGASFAKVYGTGPLDTAGGWIQQAHVWLPYCILGEPVSKMMSAAVAGPSIENGISDGVGDGLNGAGGYMRRMLGNVSGQKIARINLGKSGETAKSFIANSAKRRAILSFCNHVLCGYGGNDYSVGETLADTQTRMTQAWALLKAGTTRWVEQYGLSPKTDSTDAWATVANQTPRAGYATGGAWRDAGNTWLNSRVGADANLNAFINLETAQVDAVARDKWRVDLGQPTLDGTHPNSVVAAAMAAQGAPHIEVLRAAWEV